MGFGSNVATVAGVIIALVAAVLAILQFKEAKQERVEASLALQYATNAVARAESTAEIAENRAEEIRRMQSLMLKNQETVQVGIIRRNAFTPPTDDGWNFLFHTPLTWLLKNQRDTGCRQYTMYIPILMGLTKHPELLAKITKDNIEQVSTDFAEILVFRWLCENYNMSWLRNPGVGTPSSPFFRAHNCYDYPQTTPRTLILREELTQTLDMNFFAPMLQSRICLPNGISVPAGTALSTKREDLRRTILFSHEAFSLKITIHSMGSGSITTDDFCTPSLVELLDLKGEWFLQRIVVLFQVEYEPAFALTEDSVHIHQWIKGMMTQFCEDFDWHAITDDLLCIGTPSSQIK